MQSLRDNRLISLGNKLIPLGTATRYGRVVGVNYNGERQYFLMEGSNCISVIPAVVLECEYNQLLKEV